MFDATDTKDAPWFIVRTDVKKRGRLNCIAQLLKQFPYEPVHKKRVELPKRSEKHAYDDQKSLRDRRFVEEKY
jgi:hypothetical protein